MLRKIILTFIVLFTGCFTLKAQKSSSDSAEAVIDFYASKFKVILQTIYQNYDDKVDIVDLSDKCFNAMLTSLDPFSHYFSAETWKKMLADSRGSDIGVGLELFNRNDTLNVVCVSEGSPAELAGIKSGDKILFIDGQSFIGKSVAQADEILSGEDNSKVELIIKQKDGNELKALSLIRHEYEIPSVATEFIMRDNKMLYIKLLRFSDKTPDELRKIIRSYSQGSYKGIMLDLRDNQGGNLEAVIDVCKDFTHKGDTILTTKARNPEYLLEYINEREGEFAKIPVVVAVNQLTASASEIVCGVMQDLDRGIVVGTITTGKGLVQNSWKYSDTSAFRITVAKYYTPHGRLIQKPYNIDTNNLIPEDVKLNMSEEEFQKLKETMIQNGGLNKATVCKSRKGRILFGNGGIRPDLDVPCDTVTLLTQVIQNRGILVEYALDYVALHRSELLSRFKNYKEFVSKYVMSEVEFENFTQFYRSKNIWNDEMLKTDKDILRIKLEAVIGYLIWGNSAYYGMLTYHDSQISACAANLPQAVEIMK